MTDPIDWARIPTASMADVRLRGRVKTWERTQERAGHRVTGRVMGDELLLEAWADQGPVQARAIDSFTDHPGLTEQIAMALGYSARPWTPRSVADAVGVPAVHRAVTLIPKTIASLSMQVWESGRLLPADDRPRLAVRPDPFRTYHDFWRDAGYAMATLGEAVWYVAARDGDDRPISVLNIHPQEVKYEDDPDDPRYPIISWRGRSTKAGTLRREDIVQVTLMRSPGSWRGFGPLQACGAAVSVAVAAEEWAANFFAVGGYPSIWIKSGVPLGGDNDGTSTDEQEEAAAFSEAQRLKHAWTSLDPNTPYVSDDTIDDIKAIPVDPQGAQMLDARLQNTAEVAQMFGMPGSLLEYGRPGSSITYQNLETEKQKLVDTCVGPYYLEPLEQAFSDLLGRRQTARFNRFAFLQADIKTRFEVYKLGIESGVLDVDRAQVMEGIIPGDVETAAVPPAPPSAVPASLPAARVAEIPTTFRCEGSRIRRRSGVPYVASCERELEAGFTGTCPRCKKDYPAAA